MSTRYQGWTNASTPYRNRRSLEHWCNSGYWKTKIDEQDHDKTVFISHHGLFHFVRMPFGLTNAPYTFQHAIYIVLSSVRWKFSIVYLDDIIIFSKWIDYHMTHLKVVLSLLKDGGLTLKVRKCFFVQDRSKYLGHIVTT